jgi:hypothetical protein
VVTAVLTACCALLTSAPRQGVSFRRANKSAAPGTWALVLTLQALMLLLFSRIQNYYRAVGLELDLGRLPHRPLPASSVVVVPVGSISKLTEHALHAALSLSDESSPSASIPEPGGEPPPGMPRLLTGPADLMPFSQRPQRFAQRPSSAA